MCNNFGSLKLFSDLTNLGNRSFGFQNVCLTLRPLSINVIKYYKIKSSRK